MIACAGERGSRARSTNGQYEAQEFCDLWLHEGDVKSVLLASILTHVSL